jgi:hypothetical protein
MTTEDDAKTLQSIRSLYPANMACEDIWDQTFAAGIERGVTKEEARKLAADAFRTAMPRLLGSQSVRYFIDCVARGIVLGVFTAQESTRLLYAAQIAISAIPKIPQSKLQTEKRYNSPYFTADQLNERLKQS